MPEHGLLQWLRLRGLASSDADDDTLDSLITSLLEEGNVTDLESVVREFSLAISGPEGRALNLRSHEQYNDLARSLARLMAAMESTQDDAVRRLLRSFDDLPHSVMVQLASAAGDHPLAQSRLQQFLGSSDLAEVLDRLIETGLVSAYVEGSTRYFSLTARGRAWYPAPSDTSTGSAHRVRWSADVSDAMTYTFAAESVTAGDSDKFADVIADAVLDAYLEMDPGTRLQCDVLVSAGLVTLSGEVQSSAYVELPQLVRATACDIGYIGAETGFDGLVCGVTVNLEQRNTDEYTSPSEPYETRDAVRAQDARKVGAPHNAIVCGYACDETPDFLPLPIWLAQRLTRRLDAVRLSVPGLHIRPDGGVLTVVRYSSGLPHRVQNVTLSVQSPPDVSLRDLTEDVRRHVVDPVLAELGDHREDIEVLINPEGIRTGGGPAMRSGCSGRRLMADTYGGFASPPSGALSGRDPSSVNRSGAYAARWVAKHIVASGVASRCEIKVAYSQGEAEPVSMLVETFGTERVDPRAIAGAVSRTFDLRPAAIVSDMELRRPIYRATASGGHFGRSGAEFPWESTQRVADLQSDLS